MASGKQPCEIIVGEVLPTVRAYLAHTLLTEHGCRQTEAAKLLGITQAAISQYMTGRRGDEDLLKDFPEIQNEIREIAAKLVENVGDKERERMLCKLCRLFQTKVLKL